MRLERLLSRLPGPVNKSARSEMLRSRLWSGLRDLELKNVSRFLYEKTDDYNTFRKELRAIEEDLKQSRPSSNPIKSKTECKIQPSPGVSNSKGEKADVVEAKQYATSVENRVLKQLETLTKQMQSMEVKLSEMDAEIKGLKSDRRVSFYNNRPRYRDRVKEASEEQKPEKPIEKVTLNDKRPPS